MANYIEITVLPDLEADGNFLMSNLCSKLHSVLGKSTQGQVGISFPDYAKKGKNLGNIIRLHGSQTMLEKLMSQPWLKGLRDYCQCSEIKPVPEVVQHRSFARRQYKSAHNKRQRSINKGWLSEQEAQVNISDDANIITTLPYLQLISKSSQQAMYIFVEQGPVVEKITIGSYNSYGLSRLSEKVTVPWF
jgi:CRISPR-associated endonuclease Csy4